MSRALMRPLAHTLQAAVRKELLVAAISVDDHITQVRCQVRLYVHAGRVTLSKHSTIR